jgi:hypothetical protein
VTRAISRDKSAWRLEFSGQEFSGQEGVEFGGQTEFGGQEFRNLVVRNLVVKFKFSGQTGLSPPFRTANHVR